MRMISPTTDFDLARVDAHRKAMTRHMLRLQPICARPVVFLLNTFAQATNAPIWQFSPHEWL